VDHLLLLQDIMNAEIRDGGTVSFVHTLLGNAYVDSSLVSQRGVAKTDEFYFFNRGLLKEILPDRWKGVRVDQMLLRFDGAFRKVKDMCQWALKTGHECAG
jgi:hypothetical protein